MLAARPWQWPKNALAALGVLLVDGTVATALTAFFVATVASIAVYLYNDLRDREEDRRDPVKAGRPIASGALAPVTAGALSLLLAVTATVLAGQAVGVVGAYLAVNVLYSQGLKKIPYLEVVLVASGFPLRVLLGVLLAGGGDIGLLPGAVWLAAVGVVAAKRHGEIHENHDVRSVNRSYTTRTLTVLRVAAFTLAVGVSTVPPSVPRLAGAAALLVMFLRFEASARRGGEARPDRSVPRDPVLVIGALLWALCTWLAV